MTCLAPQYRILAAAGHAARGDPCPVALAPAAAARTS